ncbi:hypothetical protein MOQ29_01370 [Stenotrophomonas maltophilia]|nr:hypothetical protein [Stenotrophomonas maltophilia]
MERIAGGGGDPSDDDVRFIPWCEDRPAAGEGTLDCPPSVRAGFPRWCGPIDFCDAQHVARIEEALRNEKPNFNQHYLLVQADDRPGFFQRSVVLVDTRTGRATPLPIDAFTGPAEKGGDAIRYGTLETGVDRQQFCLDGALLVYRAFEEGRFCFGFDGERFTGHETQYMQPMDGR